MKTSAARNVAEFLGAQMYRLETSLTEVRRELREYTLARAQDHHVNYYDETQAKARAAELEAEITDTQELLTEIQGKLK